MKSLLVSNALLAYWNGTCFRIDGVIPPDEYATGVNNSYFTNYVAFPYPLLLLFFSGGDGGGGSSIIYMLADFINRLPSLVSKLPSMFR